MMQGDVHLPLPTSDPVTGGSLYISELTGEESGITIRGRFGIPPYARLDGEQQRFLETFLRCRGMLSSVEKELGLSYPTVRARLDGLLEALGLVAVEKEDGARKESSAERKRRVLEQLERGEISAEDAKRMLWGEK